MIRNLLIFGRAKLVMDEVAQAMAKVDFDAVMAIGRVGVNWQRPLNYWCTFHTNELEQWIIARRQAGLPPAGEYWTSTRGRTSTQLDAHVKKMDVVGGSSAMIGVMVARYRLFAQRVVLCGCPLDPEAGYVDKDGEWKEAIMHRPAWRTAHKAQLLQGVVSMSGWTKELLGGL